MEDPCKNWFYGFVGVGRIVVCLSAVCTPLWCFVTPHLFWLVRSSMAPPSGAGGLGDLPAAAIPTIQRVVLKPSKGSQVAVAVPPLPLLQRRAAQQAPPTHPDNVLEHSIKDAKGEQYPGWALLTPAGDVTDECTLASALVMHLEQAEGSMEALSALAAVNLNQRSITIRLRAPSGSSGVIVCCSPSSGPSTLSGSTQSASLCVWTMSHAQAGRVHHQLHQPLVLAPAMRATLPCPPSRRGPRSKCSCLCARAPWW